MPWLSVKVLRHRRVNGVALGSNSRADRTSGEWGYNVKTEDGRTNGYAGLGGSALRSEYAAVSVGNEGHTRQITHVAAGSKDTDAVNVAQLRNVNLKVGANTGHTDVLLDSQILKIQGDNQYVTTQAGSGTVTVGLTDAVRQKIDASANINLSNITNEGKTVIHNEAQKAVVVKGGSNTTVTSTVANGTKTYTVTVGIRLCPPFRGVVLPLKITAVSMQTETDIMKSALKTATWRRRRIFGRYRLTGKMYRPARVRSIL